MKKKIKVLHVLHSVGGVDVYLRLVTENCNPELIENIIVHGGVDKKYHNKNGEEVVQYIIPVKREINIIEDIKCIYKTIKILKKEAPNIIHAHSAKGGIIARMASLFYHVKVLHTPHAYSYLSTDSVIKRRFFLAIEKILKHFNSILVATSESSLFRGINEVGYRPNKALLFNNSINSIELNEKRYLKEFKFPNKYICTVGRPSYQKNIEMMVEIIKEVKRTIPDIHLAVMGLGVVSPNTENVKKLISKYNLESNFTLIDWMEREKALQIIVDSDFYLSTARYEGLPYAIIESLALSKAVIATDCDGNRDLVKNGYNGFLIAQNDIKSAEKRILELYQDIDMRRKFEENSLRLFQKEFNLTENIKKLEKIYLDYSK